MMPGKRTSPGALAAALAFLASPLDAGVRINEVMASNLKTFADEDGQFEDWIELYNTTAATVDLDGWGLSDDPLAPFRWTFPAGTTIAPGGYLLVWASGKNRPGVQNPSAVPDSLGGLVVWLRADTAVFSQGQAVASWQDSSGRGNHATQSVSSQRPTFATNAINGLPALAFNRSSSQQLFLPTTTFNGMADLSNFTFLAVARWTGGAQSGLFGGYRGSNTSNVGSSAFEISNTGGALRLRLPSPIDSTVSAAVTRNQWHVLGASMDQAAATARMFRDGAVIAEAAGSTGTSLLGNFARLPVGSSFDDSRTFGGQIAEVLLYNRSLSALERAALERHFSAKYNLALQTPSVSSPAHTDFRITASGEALVLTRPDGSIADQLAPVAMPADVSYGRDPAQPASWSLRATATPGAANHPQAYVPPPAPVGFSHLPGVHSQSFPLSLTHPDPAAVIIYTLDGSEPDISRLSGTTYSFRSSYNTGPMVDMTTTSLTYQGPITVTDRSPLPNRISLVPTTSDSNPSYLPVAPVKKATVVRARAYVNGLAGPETAATYFVSPSSAFEYPVAMVSMMFNERDFFDYDHGIQVAGVDHVTSTGGRICNWGNFNRLGRTAERPGRFQLFENGGLTLDQGAGFRIHGNCSRRNAFKSMRINADSEYDARNEFVHPFFSEPVPDSSVPGNTAHKSLILRSPSINEVSFCRLYQPVFGGVGGRLRPVIQFFNGEYWGLSYLRDRLDENYLARHYDLDPDNLTLVNIKYGHEVGSTDLRVFDLDHGIPTDMDDFQAMRTFITSNNMAVAANYEQARSLLDTRSFIDHLIFKIFAGDDHYAPEYVFWRARTPQDAGFGDGRWRVIVKDFDSTLFTSNYVTGLANGTHPRPFGFEIFRSLLDNTSFRNDFINRFADLLNAHFQPARFQSIIHAAYNEAQPVWNEMASRWNNVAFSNPSRPFTVSGRDALLAWSNDHPPRQRGHIRSHFGITSDVNLTVNVSNPAHGHVRVNTIDINGSTPGLASQPYPWTGVYFHNIPVKLTARPATGHRLAGWRLNGATAWHSVSPEITLTPAAATTVEAVFEPLATIHRWDFENAATFLQPGQSAGGGAGLTVSPGPLTEVLRNTASQNFTTAHLRANFPLGSSLVWSLPSTGFGSLAVSWLTRRSGQGAGTHTVETTTDGVLWSLLATYEVADAAPQLKSFDLSNVPGAANNPLFALRVTFSQGSGGSEGNNRFDDFTLSGAVLPGGQPPASIAFASSPAGTSSGSPLPPVSVRLLDASGLPAVSYNGPVTVSLSGNGTLGGPPTVNAVNGTATFDGLVITGSGLFRLVAAAPGLASVQSAAFRSLALTEIVVPQFIQGGQDVSGANNQRVPAGWRGRIEGLEPLATYRFANRAVLASDPATSDGAGNMVFITGAATDWLRGTANPGFLAGDLGAGHFTFTAGADGTFTGWFITEPTGNGRFSPGNILRFRLLLNDGAGGQAAAHILTTTQSARVIRFGALPGDGSALVGPALTRSRHIALLFGDAAGLARPLAATPVEDTGAAVDATYAPFYQILAPGHWGTILPNDLPGGLRRVEVRPLASDGSVETRIAPAGFAGTLNPSAGLDPVLLAADAGFAVLLPGGNASWHDPGNWSTATVPDSPGISAIIGAPSGADRGVSLASAATLGTLRFRQNAPPFSNSLRSAGPVVPLWLDGAGQPAVMRIENSAPGTRVTIEPGVAVQLASDLVIDDGGHTLRIAGSISGAGRTVTKAGTGTLELAGVSPPAGTPAVLVGHGILTVTGSHPAAIALAQGATLSGHGSTGPISGAGTVSTGTGRLTAPASAAGLVAAVLAEPGQATGNGALVLTDPSNPLPALPARVDLFLPASRAAGDRFHGGLVVPHGYQLAAALAGTEVRLLLADPAGGILHLGQSYRPALSADLLTWSVVSPGGGKTIEVLQGGVPGDYAQWRRLRFDDPTQRADDAFSGPAASAAGDGVANLIRYAHGVGPLDPVRHLLPHLTHSPGAAAVFRFRFDPSIANIDWIVRASSDLDDWSTVLFDSRIHTPPAADAGGWTPLELPQGTHRRFVRLEIRAR